VNLRWDTPDGKARRTGTVRGDISDALADCSDQQDLEQCANASAPAQTAALWGDMCYNNPDLRQGLCAGLFTEAQIADLPLVAPAYAEVDARHPGIDAYRRRHEALRRVFGYMVSDLIETSKANLDGSGAQSAQDIRDLGRPVIAFSAQMWAALKQIRAFLFANMYRAPRVMAQRARVTRAVEALFPIYMADPSLLPRRWHPEIISAQDETTVARSVADYIAGMTDRFALQQHANLTGEDVMNDGV